MAGHEVFDQTAEVNSFNFRKQTLVTEHSDWLPEQVQKQALIDFNTVMFPRQVETYFSEKRGDLIGQVKQQYRIVEGRLVDDFYGPFQKMIDYATSDEERITLQAFEIAAVQAKPGEIINILDTSALGWGEGIKYMDTFEKTEDGLVEHKERIDLTGEGEDLSFDEAKIVLEQMNFKPEFDQKGVVVPLMMIELVNEERINFQEEIISITEPVLPESEITVIMPARLDLAGSVLVESKVRLQEEPKPAGREDKQPAKKVLAGSQKVMEKKMTKPEVIVFKPMIKKEVGIEKKAEIVVRQKPTRILLVGQQKEKKIEKVERVVGQESARIILADLEKELITEKAKQVELVPEKVVIKAEKQTGKKEERKRENKPVMKRVVWQRQEIQPEKTRTEVKKIKKEGQKENDKPAIPIWQVELNPIDAKEIPWWQPNLAAASDETEAIRIVALTIFFLIVNTKWGKEDKKMIKVKAVR